MYKRQHEHGGERQCGALAAAGAEHFAFARGAEFTQLGDEGGHGFVVESARLEIGAARAESARSFGGCGGLVEVDQGAAGSDALCSQTLDMFCALLGGFAGNVALTLGARGGLYIGGGIVPRFADRFFASAFRQRFEAKGRFQPYLAAIPTALITDTLAALSGAALAIEQAVAPAITPAFVPPTRPV